MKNKQKGFIVPIIIVAVLIIGVVSYVFLNKKEVTTSVVDTIEKSPDKTSQTSPINSQIVSTPVVKKDTTVVNTKVNTEVTVPVIVKKNIYTNTTAGYSVELPQNWMTNIDNKVADPKITHIFLSIKNQTVDQQGFSFDIQTNPKQYHIDNYVKAYSKTPTDEDLVNSFIETQKSFQDQFVLQGTKKVVINGNTAYEVSALFAGGGGTQKFYVFYTTKTVYMIMIQAVTKTWPSHEAEVLGVVGTFKIQ